MEGIVEQKIDDTPSSESTDNDCRCFSLLILEFWLAKNFLVGLLFVFEEISSTRMFNNQVSTQEERNQTENNCEGRKEENEIEFSITKSKNPNVKD